MSSVLETYISLENNVYMIRIHPAFHHVLLMAAQPDAIAAVSLRTLVTGILTLLTSQWSQICCPHNQSLSLEVDGMTETAEYQLLVTLQVTYDQIGPIVGANEPKLHCNFSLHRQHPRQRASLTFIKPRSNRPDLHSVGHSAAF